MTPEEIREEIAEKFCRPTINYIIASEVSCGRLPSPPPEVWDFTFEHKLSSQVLNERPSPAFKDFIEMLSRDIRYGDAGPFGAVMPDGDGGVEVRPPTAEVRLLLEDRKP